MIESKNVFQLWLFRVYDQRPTKDPTNYEFMIPPIIAPVAAAPPANVTVITDFIATLVDKMRRNLEFRQTV